MTAVLWHQLKLQQGIDSMRTMPCSQLTVEELHLMCLFQWPDIDVWERQHLPRLLRMQSFRPYMGLAPGILNPGECLALHLA